MTISGVSEIKMSATSSNMSNNTDSQRMKRAAEFWKRIQKTQGKTPFKRSGQPKKSTKYAKAVKKQTNRAAQRKALNAQQPVYNFDGQRNAVRELQQLINTTPRRARPAPEFPPGMGFSPKRRRVNNNKTSPTPNTKRRRLNIGRPVRLVKKIAKKIANRARKKTAAAKTIQRAVRARKPIVGRLNSNLAPIVPSNNNTNNNNNRNANANVNVFRNKSGIVRVRRTSNNVHGTKNRWKHKLKTGSTSNNNLKNKHGNKNWHRHRPRGRYTSTTRCEFIAPKDALLRLASERGIQVNSKLSKAQICERLVNGS